MSEQTVDVVAEGALTLPEAERFAGLKRSYLYELMSSGQLASIKLGKRRLVPRAALVELLRSGLRTSTAVGAE